MMSHINRRDTERPVTLASLAAVGYQPQVYESTALPSSQENRRMARKIFADGGPVLFFEDDVSAAPSLPEWVEVAQNLDVLATFCLITPGCHPPEIKLALDMKRPIPRRFMPIVNAHSWYGVQAVYLPARAVDAMNADPHFMDMSQTKLGMMWTGWDIWLRRNLDSLGPMYAAFPNPVQHRDPPKLVPLGRTRPRRASRTFGK